MVSFTAVIATLLGLSLLYGLGQAARQQTPWWGHLRQLLTPPSFAEAEKARRAALLTFILQGLMLITLVFVPLLELFAGANEIAYLGLTGLVIVGLLSVCYWAMRRGLLTGVALALPTGLFIVQTFNLLLVGPRTPGVAVYFVVVVIAGLLLGGRGAWCFALLSLGILLAFYGVEQSGWYLYPAVPVTGLRAWLLYTSIFGLVALCLHLAYRTSQSIIRRLSQMQQTQAQQAQELDLSLQAERRRAHQMEFLADMARRLDGLENVQAMLDEVVQRLYAGFRYAHVALFLIEQDTLRLKAVAGEFTQSYPLGLQRPLNQGLVGSVAHSGETNWLSDTATAMTAAEVPTSASAVAVPLHQAQRVVGVLNVEHTRAHAFDYADVRLLESLADLIVAALQSSSLVVQLRERIAADHQNMLNLEALRQASLNLTSTLDYETVLDRLLQEITKFVPCDHATIMLVDETETQCWVARMQGFQVWGPVVTAQVQSLNFIIARTPNLRLLCTTRQPQIVSDVPADPAWLPLPNVPPIGSWIGMPLVVHGRIKALFSLEKNERKFYQPHHAERLAAFAGPAALAFQNAQLFAEEQQRTQEQQLLFAATRDFTAGLSESAVLNATAQHLTAALQATGCSISLWDPTEDCVVTVVDYAAPGEPWVLETVGTKYALTEYPLTRQVLVTRHALVLWRDDPYIDPAEKRLLQERGHGGVFMLPLTARTKVWGLVEAYRSPQQAPFSLAEQQLALNLIAQAAAALDNAHLHTTVKENVRELDALLRANEALLSTLELDPLLKNILSAAMAALPAAEKGTILLLNPSTQRLQVHAQVGYTDARLLNFEWVGGESYAERAVREKRPLLVRDVPAEGFSYDGDITEVQAVQSAIVSPLWPKTASIFGAISLDATEPDIFTEADLRLLVAFANTAAVAIENARLHAEVQRLAITDGLTGLANHRAFMHALYTEVSRAARYQHPLSLIIMDVDSFKYYNDTYGHLAGNERLQALAHLLQNSVRYPDLPARFGGEEFALLLPHTDKEGALILAERIRAAAEAVAPKAPEHATAPGAPISGYTFSMGVATFPSDAFSADELMRVADDAEIEAKHQGKNRVCAAPHQTHVLPNNLLHPSHPEVTNGGM